MTKPSMKSSGLCKSHGGSGVGEGTSCYEHKNEHILNGVGYTNEQSKSERTAIVFKETNQNTQEVNILHMASSSPY